jgi:hypothetical protein
MMFLVNGLGMFYSWKDFGQIGAVDKARILSENEPYAEIVSRLRIRAPLE